MACVRCSREIPDDAAFCQYCGVAQRDPVSDGQTKRYLRRSQVDRQVAGVCGGIADYFDTDPVFVRAAWVILTIIPGAIFLGVLAYLAAWLIIPEAQPGSEAPVPEPMGGSWRTKRLYRSRERTTGSVASVEGSRSTSRSTRRRFACSGSFCRSSQVRSSVAC